MTFLIEQLWPALAAAFALGLVAGPFGVAPKPMSRSGRARVALAGFCSASLAVASGARWVFGEAGLWLDGGLLLALAYAAGCCTGWVPGRLLRRRPIEPAAPAEPAANT